MRCRWGAWHGDEALALEFPAGWDASLRAPADARQIGDEAIDQALSRPIGALSVWMPRYAAPTQGTPSSSRAATP